MARLRNGTDLVGMIGNLSSYKITGIEDTIVRTRSGPTREKIRNHPNFEPVRKNNNEFGGRSTCTSWILQGLRPLKPLIDYNIAGPLNALLKSVQAMDAESETGRRHIELSRNPGVLEGFQLNKRNVFEMVVRAPVLCTLNKEDQTARVELPALTTGNNFFPVDQYPVFRWQASLAAVPDLFCDEKCKYQPKDGFAIANISQFTGEWHACSDGTSSEIVELALPYPIVGEAFCLLLAVGIGFGTLRAGGAEGVRYAGSGKVVGMKR